VRLFQARPLEETRHSLENFAYTLRELSYFFDCTTTDAPITAGYFRVHNGKVIPAQVKTPCWTKEWQIGCCPCLDRH
jgi:hypothetical protein